MPEKPLANTCRAGRNGPRSKNGCWTCRIKKVRCDETRPHCRRCTRLSLFCDYSPRRKATCISAARNHVVSLSSTLALSLLPVNSPSALPLTSTDHESIRYFRATFSKIQHTKNPAYSVYGIIFEMAKSNAMLMHAILAIGGQEVEFRRRCHDNMYQEKRNNRVNRASGLSPVDHYSDALRLMATEIYTIRSKGGCPMSNLDMVLAGLFLLVLYERKYGDARCIGLRSHLLGVAAVLQHCLQSSPLVVHADDDNDDDADQQRQGRKTASLQHDIHRPATTAMPFSLFSARILVYLVSHDASASIIGVGGQLNTILSQGIGGESATSDWLSDLHKFSHPLYRMIWADTYPQSELVDDIENRTIFQLATARSKLKHKIARLSMADSRAVALEMSMQIQLDIDNMDVEFSEILVSAAELSEIIDCSRRLVANIRSYVPQYYAALVHFQRVKRRLGIGDGDPKLDVYINIIMNLAIQKYHFEGTDGLIFIAWPLYVVALETKDTVQREWIIARFQAMACCSLNLQRAYNFLVSATAVKTECGDLLDSIHVEMAHLRSDSSELFVI